MKSILHLSVVIAAFVALSTTSLLAEKKPNVLLIVFDDLNTHVSTSGYNEISTPTFDRLAADGITLKRAYCQYPVCGPSRASFLSGLYPESTGILSNFDDIRTTRPGTKSMPQTFKEQGYWTGAVGKVFHNAKTNPGDVAWNEWHYFENDELPLVTPIRQQFEKENGPINSSKKVAKKWKDFYLTIAPQTANQKPGYGPTGLRDEQHDDGKNTRQIVSWLKNKSHGDQPFFMACGIHKPHAPYLAPDAYFEMYPKDKLTVIPAPADYWKQAPKIAQTGRYKGFDFELGVENDALRRDYIQAYHACISFVDAQVGLIFDTLESEGLADDTIVVLMSDHGYLLGEKFMWGKVFLWDLGTRVPLIIRAPGITTPGSSSQSLVELVDIFPTLAELCDITPPDDLQGKSIVPILKDPETTIKDYAYTVVLRGKVAGKTIHGGRFHYVLWPDGSEELYDLQNDPDENKNLAGSPEYRTQLQAMHDKLTEVEAIAVSQAHE